MWTSSPSLALLLAAVALAGVSARAGAESGRDGAAPREESAVENPAEGAAYDEAWSEPAVTALAEHRQALDAHEARLELWERDLTRRASGEDYFTDLEGYVTPSALARAFVLGCIVSVVSTLLLLRALERRGMWRTAEPSRGAAELQELEGRVLTGLREFDGLLSRVYERLQSESSGTGGRAGLRSGDHASPVIPEHVLTTPSGRPPRASSIRRQVLSLAGEGIDREEIGRRLGIGHAEVDFIIRAEARR